MAIDRRFALLKHTHDLESFGFYHGSVAGTGLSVHLPDGWTSEKITDGQFRVTHNLGTTNYSLIPTAHRVAATEPIVANGEKSTNRFDVYIFDGSNSAANEAFDFILLLVV